MVLFIIVLGTRFYVRGVDEEGNAANFVETEHIICYNDYTCSYIITRGSIPINWSQRPNLKFKPSISINDTRSHVRYDYLKKFSAPMTH
jgi:hypothetical protein